MFVCIYQFTQCNIPEDLIFSIITVRASNITLYILLIQNNAPEFKSKYLLLCRSMHFNFRENTVHYSWGRIMQFIVCL